MTTTPTPKRLPPFQQWYLLRWFRQPSQTPRERTQFRGLETSESEGQVDPRDYSTHIDSHICGIFIYLHVP